MEQRLQKLIAEAGIASRRRAEELILGGEVSVNGETVTTLGTKADPARDHIKVRGKLINPLLEGREKLYVLLNKPRGYLSSVADPEGRPLVTELVPASLGRLHPVGRLDFNTEGLLVLTNDGELTNFITAARNKVPKVYEVKVKGKPPEAALERLRRGVMLEEDGRDVRTAPADITLLGESETNAWFDVILREGRNQQIRRMFDAIGHSVVKLRRVRIGALMDENLRTGQWRLLMPTEVASLKKSLPDAALHRPESLLKSDRRPSVRRAAIEAEDDARGKSRKGSAPKAKPFYTKTVRADSAKRSDGAKPTHPSSPRASESRQAESRPSDSRPSSRTNTRPRPPRSGNPQPREGNPRKSRS